MSFTLLNKALTKKAQDLTGRKRCSSCGFYKPLDGGQVIFGGHNVKRWMCASCLAKRQMFLEEI